MSFIILIIAIINILLILVFIKKNYFGILTVTSWWFFWLFISTFSNSKYFLPQEGTYWLFISMISSITLGGLVYKLTKKGYQKPFRHELNPYDFVKTNKRFFILNAVFVIPFLVIFLYKFYDLILVQKIIFDGEYRNFIARDYKIIEDERIALLYGLFISPMPYVSLFASGAVISIHRNYKLFFVSSLIILINSTIFSGRFGIYSCIIILCLSFFYGRNFELKNLFANFSKQFKKLRRNFTLLAIIVLCLLSTIFFITYARFSSGGISFYEAVIQRSIVNYHTVGFTIFDQELNATNSILEDKTYGLSSVGNLERIYYLIASRFNKNVDSISVQNLSSLDEFRLVGRRQMSNAFGTNLFLLYRDGGLLFTSIFSAVYGFYLSKLEHSDYKLSIRNSSILLVFIHEGIMGIFVPTYNFMLFIIMVSLLTPSSRKWVKYKRMF
jgi:oligosaccharide repeat unit polymerase